MTAGTGLSRELLKWLQSLDLSYSVKNVKRDFSNGYLIAEIFSRYYQQDVEMHSYDNGQALQRKLDNWAQLFKFFNKKGIKLDRDCINDVVHCKSNEAPVKLLSAIYKLLTGRDVLMPKALTEQLANPEVLPQFARPNASSLLNANIRESEMTTTLEDLEAAQARAKSLIDDHNSTVRQERAMESRYMGNTAYNSSTVQRVLRGPPKPVSQDIESTQVRFQEVKVRTVDRNIAQLRATRDQQMQGAFTGTPQGTPQSFSTGGLAPSDTSAAAPAVVGVDVLQLLSQRIVSDASLGLGGLGRGAQPFDLFLKHLPQLPVEAAAAVFGLQPAELDAVAAACAASPKQAWQLFHLILSLLAVCEHAPVFSAAVGLLCQVGMRLVAMDSQLADGLLRDFGLPRLLLLVKVAPAKQRELLQVIYAFSANTAEAHIGAIKAVQDGLGADGPAFALALTSLITLEVDFSDDLLDLYVYYCVIALGMPSCRLRAAALSMLPVVCSQNRELVVQMLPRLSVLAADPWWEIQAQLGKLYCALLAGASASSAEASSVASMLGGVLGCRSPAVATVALAEAAPLLSRWPALLSPFVSSLLSLPPQQRAALLAPNNQPVPVPATSCVLYDIRPLPMRWPPLLVANQLIASAKAQNSPYLESGHVQILSAIFNAPLSESESAAWQQWLLESKDYLYVALCDEDLCEKMSSVLLAIFDFLQDGALASSSTLLSSLRMIFNGDGNLCQNVALVFLNELFDRGMPFAGAVANLVGSFDNELRATALSQIVARVDAEFRAG